jgi:hypothetical protein
MAPTAPTTDVHDAEDAFRLQVAHVTITPDTIIGVLALAMQAMESTKLKGVEKRDAVIRIVRQAVIDAPIPDATEALLLEMVEDGIVGSVIDIVVSAARGELHLNASLDVGKILCSTLGPLAIKLCNPCIPCTSEGTSSAVAQTPRAPRATSDPL